MCVEFNSYEKNLLKNENNYVFSTPNKLNLDLYKKEYVKSFVKNFYLNNLIAFEGIDGSGKSTIIELLKQDKDFIDKITYGKEYQDESIGIFVNKYLMENKTSNKLLEALTIADHVEHMDKIKQSLETYKLYISDRHCWSWYAYSKYDPIVLNTYNDFTQQRLVEYPEYVFYFYTNLENSMKRIQNRPEDRVGLADTFSNKLEEKLKKYDYLLHSGLFNVIYIDTNNKTIEQVYEIVKTNLLKILESI